MAVYDLSEKLTQYGIHDIKVQSFANGYEPSDPVELTYSIGAKIKITRGIVTLLSVISGVTAFDVFIDGVQYGTKAYDGTPEWNIDVEDYTEALVDGKHSMTLRAVGVGIEDNRSNEVTWYKGVAPVYGVSWVNDDTTTMTRTDQAEGMSYAIQSSDGSIASDFNDVFPWNEATIVELEAGKFLHMPEMYFRITTDNANKITGVAVSKTPGDGDWYKTAEFYYGIYGASSTGSTLQSVAGVQRLYSQTRATFRNRARATGEGYQQLDLYHRTIMTFLWWIEWATKNSESIMVGKTSATGSSRVQTGGTDSVNTPSGFNTTTKQMRYHYIEDFIGNYMEWVDGVAGSTSNKVWVSADPTVYADTNGASGYNQLAYATTGNGYAIKAFGWDSNNPFLCYYHTASGSNYNQGFCDYGSLVSSSGPVLFVGAHWNNSSTAYGLVSFSYASASYTSGAIGGRLLYKP